MFSPACGVLKPMDLQQWFYLVGIVYMTLSVLLMLAAVMVLIVVKQRLTELNDSLKEKVDTVRRIVEHPREVAVGVGAAVTGAILSKAADLVDSKKKSATHTR